MSARLEAASLRILIMPFFHPNRPELLTGINQLREQLLEALIRFNAVKEKPLEINRLRELLEKIHGLVEEAAGEAEDCA